MYNFHADTCIIDFDLTFEHNIRYTRRLYVLLLLSHVIIYTYYANNCIFDIRHHATAQSDVKHNSTQHEPCLHYKCWNSNEVINNHPVS